MLVAAAVGYGFINSSKNKEEVITLKKENQQNNKPTDTKESDIVRDETVVSEEVKDESASAENTSSGNAASLAKSAAIEYINKEIESLAPESPSEGKWRVTRFWFSSEKAVYVEYASAGESRQILVNIEGNPDTPSYRKAAYFKPGESAWSLVQGEDSEFGKSRELYEKTGENWIKKN